MNIIYIIYPSKKVNQNNPLSTIVVDSVVKSFFTIRLQLKPPSFNSFGYYIRSRCTNNTYMLFTSLSYTMVLPIRHISIDILY